MDHKATLSERGQVVLSAGLRPHLLVHRRGQMHRCWGREHQGREQIIAPTAGQSCQAIGGGRCNQNKFGPTGQLNVAHPGLGFRVQQAIAHGHAR